MFYIKKNAKGLIVESATLSTKTNNKSYVEIGKTDHGKLKYGLSKDGAYLWKWDGDKIISATGQSSEKQAYYKEEFNKQRSSLLQKTDWTQLQDVPTSTKELYATYRQELRDLPNSIGFDYKKPNWPAEMT